MKFTEEHFRKVVHLVLFNYRPEDYEIVFTQKLKFAYERGYREALFNQGIILEEDKKE